MNLNNCMRRIESFLSTVETTDSENWTRFAQTMSKLTGPGPFDACSTKDGFCGACNKTADTLSELAASEFKRQYKEFEKEVEKHKLTIDMSLVKTKADEEFALKQLNEFIDHKFAQFDDNIKDLVFNVENAFHLYYYADMLQVPTDDAYFCKRFDSNREPALALRLCQKQAAYAQISNARTDGNACMIVKEAEIHLEYDNSTRIVGDDQALSLFPDFKAMVTQPGADEFLLLRLFLDHCVVLACQTTTNHTSADHALCAIYKQCARVLKPA
jgi:hypothetical protein